MQHRQHPVPMVVGMLQSILSFSFLDMLDGDDSLDLQNLTIDDLRNTENDEELQAR